MSSISSQLSENTLLDEGLGSDETQESGELSPCNSCHACDIEDNAAKPDHMASVSHGHNFKHRASCHRCGNMRKKRVECSRCPHVFCHQCEVKMLEQFGASIFKDGCPVCKELCCCGKNRSFTCPHKFHCYKKCPATKRHSYKTATGFETASRRCLKHSLLFKELISSKESDTHSHSDGDNSGNYDAKQQSTEPADVPFRRRSARLSSLASKKPRYSCAETDSSGHSDDHHDEVESVPMQQEVKPALIKLEPRTEVSEIEAKKRLVNDPFLAPMQPIKLQRTSVEAPVYAMPQVTYEAPILKKVEEPAPVTAPNYNSYVYMQNTKRDLLEIDMDGLIERDFFDGADDLFLDFDPLFALDVL